MPSGTALIQSTLFVLILGVSLAWTHEATAARYVEANISLDGKVLLTGSLGDDGRVDPDGVWEYLKSMRFKTTDEFQKLDVATDAKEAILTSDAPAGQLGTIVVEIDYGGKAITRNLKLVRRPKDEYGREWSLDPAHVDKLFDERLIHRSDAAKLAKPRNTKR